MLTPDQVAEYSAAAEQFYSPELAYHNFDHAEAVAADVNELIDRTESRGIILARQALTVAAFWHDAGFHEDQTKYGFLTKEVYSMYLLRKYLKDKPVSEDEKRTMSQAILGTTHGAPRDSLNTLALHRADIGRIGWEYDVYLSVTKNLWDESGHELPWKEFVQSTVGFIDYCVEESRMELPRLGEPIGTAGSFDTRAKNNITRLLEGVA